MAFKVGDKAKVVDKESFLYNKTVEMKKIDNEVYIFYCESEKLNFVVHKDLIKRTIKWESSPDIERGAENDRTRGIVPLYKSQI